MWPSRLDLLLLSGVLTDEEYRSGLDAESRGLRFGLAKRGWTRRWWNVITTVLLVLAACAFAVTFAVLVLAS